MTKLTTAAGAPVVDNQNVMTAGPRGPMLLQDVWHLEKLAHFAREVIPERRMHAKGSGAFGTFTVTNDISRYTKAKIFSAWSYMIKLPAVARRSARLSTPPSNLSERTVVPCTSRDEAPACVPGNPTISAKERYLASIIGLIAGDTSSPGQGRLSSSASTARCRRRDV